MNRPRIVGNLCYVGAIAIVLVQRLRGEPLTDALTWTAVGLFIVGWIFIRTAARAAAQARDEAERQRR